MKHECGRHTVGCVQPTDKHQEKLDKNEGSYVTAEVHTAPGRRRVVVERTPRPPYPREMTLVPIVQEGQWASKTV